jgi:hypothetical protein
MAEELDQLWRIQEQPGGAQQKQAKKESGSKDFSKQHAAVCLHEGTGAALCRRRSFLAEQDIVQEQRVAHKRNAEQEKNGKIQHHGDQLFTQKIPEVSRDLKGVRDKGKQGQGNKKDEGKMVQYDRNRFFAEEKPD